jgi:hypothetical protein
MAAPANDGPAGKVGRRRWPRILLVLGVLLLATAWWVDRQLEPKRLTALVLREIGQSQGLDLAFSGEPDYAFRPEPRLLIPNLVVRQRGEQKPFLVAVRAEISLPWDTITGGEPVITRIELAGLDLDMPGLRRWQATRPPTPFKLPTLAKGLRISEGRVRDEGWSLSGLALDLPHLQAGQEAEAKLSGLLDLDGTGIALDLALKAATPGLESDFSLSGSGALQQKPQALPFKLAIEGHYRSDNDVFAIQARDFDFDGQSPLPRIKGKADMALGDKLSLSFDGDLQEWAKDWPTLPTPLPADRRPMPLQVRYSGAADLSDPLAIELRPEPTRLQASLRITDMNAWLDDNGGSPLPPLQATLSTPTLVVEGFTLEGAEIEIREAGPAPKDGAQAADESRGPSGSPLSDQPESTGPRSDGQR